MGWVACLPHFACQHCKNILCGVHQSRSFLNLTAVAGRTQVKEWAWNSQHFDTTVFDILSRDKSPDLWTASIIKTARDSEAMFRLRIRGSFAKGSVSKDFPDSTIPSSIRRENNAVFLRRCGEPTPFAQKAIVAVFIIPKWAVDTMPRGILKMFWIRTSLISKN